MNFLNKNSHENLLQNSEHSMENICHPNVVRVGISNRKNNFLKPKQRMRKVILILLAVMALSVTVDAQPFKGKRHKRNKPVTYQKVKDIKKAQNGEYKVEAKSLQQIKRDSRKNQKQWESMNVNYNRNK